jgi:hypothetical protein
MQLNIITLTRWVDQALKQSFIKKIKSGFEITGIWALNPKAMDNKTSPSKVYIIVNLNYVGNEDEYTIENEVENNPQWGKEFAIAKFLHIYEMDQCPTSIDSPIFKLKIQHYHVDMPQSPIVIEQHLIDIDVINLDGG